MRVFVAGATGVIGIRLLPRLVEIGHVAAGMTRSRNKVSLISGVGAEPVVCDVYDFNNLNRSIVGFSPDLIVDQLTDLPDSVLDIPSQSMANNRIRTEGTDNLIRAALNAGRPHFIAQSVAWKLPGEGGKAVKYLERAVLNYGGTVLRYGQLYGPGTYYETEKPEPPRIHVDAAASMTLRFLNDSGRVIEITENDEFIH